MHQPPPPHVDAIHTTLINACLPAANLVDSAAWFSAKVAATLERRGRDPWSLTLAELKALIEAAAEERS